MAKVQQYSSAEELLADPQRFDIYLLGIILPGEINGISLGRKIKEQDETAKIIYVTSDTTKAIEAYEL